MVVSCSQTATLLWNPLPVNVWETPNLETRRNLNLTLFQIHVHAQPVDSAIPDQKEISRTWLDVRTFLGLAVECTESFLCISCGEGGGAAEGDMRRVNRASGCNQEMVSLPLSMTDTLRHKRDLSHILPNIRRRSDPVLPIQYTRYSLQSAPSIVCVRPKLPL